MTRPPRDEQVLRYDTLRELGARRLEEGRLEEALGIFEAAEEKARECDDQTLRDTAYCNRVAVAISLRRQGDWLPVLKEMLLRTSDSQVARLASYNLALAYDQQKAFDKARFYGGIALDHAERSGSPEHRASALNVIGNALVALNDVAEAADAYREALDLVAERPGVVRGAVVRANLGYCHLLDGDLEAGFRAEYKSLRDLRRAGVRLFESLPRLCLCFAHLLADRPWYASTHGQRALELAEDHGDVQTEKYALLLLGETYKQAGQPGDARECFQLLQRAHYPGMAQVPDLLLGVDICRVINLKQ